MAEQREATQRLDSCCHFSWSGGRSFVVLQHATEPLAADDLLALARRVIDLGPDTEQRLVVFPLVRTTGVIIIAIGRDKMVEVTEAEDDEPVQALSPNRADPALDEGVLIRRSWRCGLNRSAVVGKDLIESFGVLKVAVSDEVADRQLHPTGLLGLPRGEPAAGLASPRIVQAARRS